jgi:dihydrolipoamide dehydrogenase
VSERFDLIVIGAGPAGYAAAIRAAQLGMNVACLDDWVNAKGAPAYGGTCLNVGCIPSKVLLEASEIYDRVRNEYSAYGIQTGEVELDLVAMMMRKEGIVERMTQGVATLFKVNGVKAFTGRGKLLPNRRVEFTPRQGEPAIFEAENVILAAGSHSVKFGAAPLQDDIIVDSAGALTFDSVPKRLGVIGAGVIGLELGCVWRRLGSEVVLLEAQGDFLHLCDEQIAREALRHFSEQGLDIRLGARVTATVIKRGKVELSYQDVHGADHLERFDRLIVAIGRRPNTDGLFASETELLLDEWGYVHVDQYCKTNLPGVYAVGDVVRGPMLAHKGAEEGVMVVERLAGHDSRVNYDTVPAVIYTRPEIAWAGVNEQTLKAQGHAYRVGSFPFAANGRAWAHGDASGFIKILADAETDRILGVHMIGPYCSELIANAVVAMEFGASSEDIGLTMFAHPTLSEAFHEAALSVLGRAIHIARKRKEQR